MSITMDAAYHTKKKGILDQIFNAVSQHESIMLEQEKPSLRLFIKPHWFTNAPLALAQHQFAQYIHERIFLKFDLDYKLVDAGWTKNAKGENAPYVGVTISGKNADDILTDANYLTWLSYQGVTEVQSSTGSYVDLKQDWPVQKLEHA